MTLDPYARRKRRDMADIIFFNGSVFGWIESSDLLSRIGMIVIISHNVSLQLFNK